MSGFFAKAEVQSELPRFLGRLAEKSSGSTFSVSCSVGEGA